MKAIKWLILSALLAVGGCISAAWYTGTRLPSELEASVEAFNAYLHEMLPNTALKLELVHVESGLFSTHVQYQLHRSGAQQALVGQATLEHGPFPWARIKQGQWLPVLASGHLQVPNTEGLEPVLQGDFQYDYRHQVRGEWLLMPLSLALDPSLQLQSAEVKLAMALNAHAGRLQLAVTTASLRLYNPTQHTAFAVTLEQPHWLLDRQRYQDDFYIGDSRLQVKNLNLKAGGLQLSGQSAALTDQLQIEQGLLQARFDYHLDQLSYAGRALGDVDLVWQVRQLAPQALQALAQRYQQPYKAQALADETEEQALWKSVLASRPEVRVDELRLTTENGTLRLNAQALFGNPPTLSQPLAQLLPHLIRELEIQLSLDKALVQDLLLSHYFQSQPQDAAAQQQAQQMSEGLAQLLTDMSAAVADGERLLTHLDYRAGTLNLNGQPISLQELTALLATGKDAPSTAQ